MKVKYLMAVFMLLVITSCNENTVEPILYGNISGIVYSSDGNTVITAVGITTNPPTSAIVSNDDGKFSFQNIPVGNYSISAGKTGYDKSSVSIAVHRGETAQAVIFLSKSESSIAEKPVNPSPANNSKDQPVTLTLSWHQKILTQSISDSTHFDVYLFESGSMNRKLIASKISDTSTAVSNLKFNTTYYWQVAAEGSDTTKVNSDIWSFTTIDVPDNPYIFSRKVDGNYQIFSSDSAMINLTQLTNNNNRNWWPRFNPKHNIIAFTSDAGVEPQIYTIHTDGTGLFQVTTVGVTGYGNFGIGFCWSPDNYNILYSHNDKLYRIGSNGTDLTLIATAPTGRNFRECNYSPDGKKIVVLTVGSNIYDSEIYMMDSDGKNMTLLVGDTAGATASPSFSIDGKYVLYTHDISGYQDSDGRILNSHIFEINIATKAKKDLSTFKPTGTNDFNPKYSADGAYIIFENGKNTINSTKDVWIMRNEDTRSTDNSNDRHKIIPNGIMPDWK